MKSIRATFRLKLRTLLVLVALIGVGLGIYMDRLRREEIRRRLAQPMLDAASRGDIVEIRRLLGAGAEVDSITNGRAPWTPLMNASAGGHTEAVQLLLARGADPNHHDLDYFGPLTFAASEGHWDVVRILIEHGADPGLGDAYGKMAIDYAKEKGAADMVRWLESKRR